VIVHCWGKAGIDVDIPTALGSCSQMNSDLVSEGFVMLGPSRTIPPVACSQFFQGLAAQNSGICCYSDRRTPYHHHYRSSNAFAAPDSGCLGLARLLVHTAPGERGRIVLVHLIGKTCSQTAQDKVSCYYTRGGVGVYG